MIVEDGWIKVGSFRLLLTVAGWVKSPVGRLLLTMSYDVDEYQFSIVEVRGEQLLSIVNPAMEAVYITYDYQVIGRL